MALTSFFDPYIGVNGRSPVDIEADFQKLLYCGPSDFDRASITACIAAVHAGLPFFLRLPGIDPTERVLINEWCVTQRFRVYLELLEVAGRYEEHAFWKAVSSIRGPEFKVPLDSGVLVSPDLAHLVRQRADRVSRRKSSVLVVSTLACRPRGKRWVYWPARFATRGN